MRRSTHSEPTQSSPARFRMAGHARQSALIVSWCPGELSSPALCIVLRLWPSQQWSVYACRIMLNLSLIRHHPLSSARPRAGIDAQGHRRILQHPPCSVGQARLAPRVDWSHTIYPPDSLLLSHKLAGHRRASKIRFRLLTSDHCALGRREPQAVGDLARVVILGSGRADVSATVHNVAGR